MANYQDGARFGDTVVYAERPRLRHLIPFLLGRFSPQVVVYTRVVTRDDRIRDHLLFTDAPARTVRGDDEVAKLRGTSVPLGVTEAQWKMDKRSTKA